MTLKIETIFTTCEPRADVLSGSTRDEHFAADLAKVINGTAPKEYATPETFFAHTHPTRGMKALLDAACRRLSGAGNEVSSIIRLDTQYGGGKTHGLIALVHAAQGGQSVSNIAEFVNPEFLPKGKVRVAAFDGDNADPANGAKLEDGLYAYTPWGQLAYNLAGREGFERVKKSDEAFTSPGALTLGELFGGEPTLIVLDEIAVYLRKAEKAHPGSSAQFPTFVRALIKAVTESPQAVLVYTLAVGKGDKEASGHSHENNLALNAFAEAEHEGARSATNLNPTEDDETADVVRRRLFAKVDHSAAEKVVSEYISLWKSNSNQLPDDAQAVGIKDRFLKSYPLHPELLEVLTKKTSTLSNFQRTRGMLRLLAKTVCELWRTQPQDAYAIHVHHIDLGADVIRSEVLTKLEQQPLAPALKGDVESTPGDSPSLAEQIDEKQYPGQLPVTTFIARTIFLNTLAYGQDLVGVAAPDLLFSVCSPALEPSFVEQARKKFVAESLYLDDHPGVPMRFQVEPNLNQMILRLMREVEQADIQTELNVKIKDLYSRSGSQFELIAFPGGPYEVPDDVSDGRPYLVIHGYDAISIAGDPRDVPADIADIYQHKGTNNEFRQLKNNVVFLVADERQRDGMKDRVRRRLALRKLNTPEYLRDLADYQQEKVKEEHKRSEFEVAQAILLCYRHLFYPSHMPLSDSQIPLAHCSIEVGGAGDSPGSGQKLVTRHLHDAKKLLLEGDAPTGAAYVRDQTPMRTKGSISAQELRNEFRRAPRLPILLGDEPFLACVHQGIDHGQFVYVADGQVWGQGDPRPTIRLNENTFVHTAEDAREKHLWPRPEPLKVLLRINPSPVSSNQPVTVTVNISGGVPPFELSSSTAKLALGKTDSRSPMAVLSLAGSQDISVKITDVRGVEETATATVTVVEGSGGTGGGERGESGSDSGPGSGTSGTPPPPPPTDLKAEGQLAQALNELGEKARKGKVDRLSKLSIRFFDWSAAFKVQPALAMLTEHLVTCRFEIEIDTEGADEFIIQFTGTIAKATKLRPFLEAELRESEERDFQPVYDVSSSAGIETELASFNQFVKSLTKFGSGEAYVEAWAFDAKEALV